MTILFFNEKTQNFKIMKKEGCGVMYWNTINRFSSKFMVRYKYPPSVIIMSWLYYINMQKEMNDNEKWVLVKTGRARGCKIIPSSSLDEKTAFVLLETSAKTRLYCYFHEIK